jgi:hypothetical protein
VCSSTPTLRSSSVIYAKLVTTPSAVYVVGTSISPASHTLHITSLSVSTGELLASIDIPWSIAEGQSDLLTLSSDITKLDSRVVWLEAGTIYSLALVPNLAEKPTPLKGPAYSKMIDVGLQNKGHFVALKADDTGRVLKLDAETACLKVVWEFADSVSAYTLSHLQPSHAKSSGKIKSLCGVVLCRWTRQGRLALYWTRVLVFRTGRKSGRDYQSTQAHSTFHSLENCSACVCSSPRRTTRPCLWLHLRL